MIAQTEGTFDFVYMLSIISVSLGVTNLLPFPPLDGGKIFMYIIEWIRRKPIKDETNMKIQAAGFTAIIVLSVYVAYRDIIRII